ncbi:uncharacterized protein, partial [Prorops nasuta]|uniref:uncharacterized protein n=1 Tax=Prorops nasuta TaxID=863751 RepID=UPI0034D00D09
MRDAAVYTCLLIKMDFPQRSYYQLNHFLLTLSGIAPYQSKISSYIIRVIYVSLCIFGGFSQALKLIQEKFEKSLFYTMFPILVYTTIFVSTYFIISNGFNKHTKVLWRMIIDDWLSQRLVEENKIKKRYAYHAWFFTTFLAVGFVLGLTSFFVVLVFFSEILDILMPLNETRPHLYMFPCETYNDEQKYFYFNITVAMCVFTVMALPT